MRRAVICLIYTVILDRPLTCLTLVDPSPADLFPVDIGLASRARARLTMSRARFYFLFIFLGIALSLLAISSVCHCHSYWNGGSLVKSRMHPTFSLFNVAKVPMFIFLFAFLSRPTERCLSST